MKTTATRALTSKWLLCSLIISALFVVALWQALLINMDGIERDLSSVPPSLTMRVMNRADMWAVKATNWERREGAQRLRDLNEVRALNSHVGRV